MPFDITVAGAVFQNQLDHCFGKIDQLIVIADDIMMGWQATQLQRP